MRCAFYITVDDGYLGIGLAQAKRLRSLWGIDVHVFIEGQGEVARDELGQNGVFVHRNLMRDTIPSDLPSTKSWPRIVYCRIFAPYLLAQYDRLIYIDADVFPMVADPFILSVDLPHGLAAVQDGSTIGCAPHTAGLSRDEWRAGIGLKSQRYFNAGILVLDQKPWCSIDFAQPLTQFMQRYGASARMQDQDFLNHHFQGRWVELSPRFNYQKALFNYGLEQVFKPVFLHFSSFQKPWFKPDHPDSVQGQFFPVYQRMFQAAGISGEDYLTSKPENPIRKLRTALRYRLSEWGIKTDKENRQRKEWARKSENIFEGIQQDGQQGRYADLAFDLPERPIPKLSFDGRYMRRALIAEFDPIEPMAN